MTDSTDRATIDRLLRESPGGEVGEAFESANVACLYCGGPADPRLGYHHICKWRHDRSSIEPRNHPASLSGEPPDSRGIVRGGSHLRRKTMLKATSETTAIHTESGIEFVWIPPGQFMMGSPASDPDAWENERPQHEVEIPEGFWMAKYPVTEAQWAKVMGEEPPPPERAKLPKTMISWTESAEFAQRIGGELPTEEEWEYACRAGTETRYPWGDEWDPSRANGTYQLQPVDAYPAQNAFGLHDLVGNVWQWTASVYQPYAEETS